MSGPQATRDAVLRQAHAALAVARGFERNVWIILIFTLGKGLQLTIVNVTLSLYAHSLGFDNALIGALVAVPSIGALIASVPMGVLADRYGRKPMLIIGGLLNPLTLAALGLATSPTWLFIFGVLNGICANAYWVTFMPVLVESTTEEQRVAALAANNFLLLGVGALGALIGGAIPELVGHVTHLQPTSTIPLRWGLVTAALVTLLPTVPLFWLRERLIPRRLARAGGDATPAPQDPPLPMRDLIRLFTMLLVPDALFVLGESSAVALLALFFNVQFGLHPGALGVYLTVAGLIGGAMSFLAPRLSRRWGKLATATTSQIATVPAVLLIGFSPVFSLSFAGELTRNILRGFFEPAYAAFAMESVSSRYRARLSSLYSVTWSIGFSIGAVVAGWLQQHVSLSAGFVVSAACIGGSALLLRLFFPRQLRPPEPKDDAMVAAKGIEATHPH